MTQLGSKRDETGRKRSDAADGARDGVPELVIMASGCLGLVYLPARARDASGAERIDELYPRLLAGLREHPGIGFALVRSEQHGAIVLGASGVRYLADDRVEGDDPLAPFGEHAADHLRRTDSFPHCADIALNSTFWADPGEVAAFEELVGSHGGMGGPQGHPFVLHPVGLAEPDGPIVGAEHLHVVFRDWLAALGHAEYAGPFQPAGSARAGSLPASDA